MTTIIAVEGKNETYWGWDSQVSSGGESQSLEYPKVFTNGDYIFGVAGYLSASQALCYAELPQCDTWDVDGFMTVTLIPALKKILKTSHVLVECKGRIYSLAGGSWIRNSRGIYTVGSGSDYATGAIAVGATPIEALQVAAEFDMGTGGILTMASGSELLGGDMEFDLVEPRKRKKGKKK